MKIKLFWADGHHQVSSTLSKLVLRIVSRDFTDLEKQDFTIRKEIIWQSEDATTEEVNRKEVELIRLFDSNNPDIGYNQWPKRKM